MPPPSGSTGFFHNLNLSFHEQRSETSNMYLFQPGEGFIPNEASGVYLIDTTNIHRTPEPINDEIEHYNLFSNPQVLDSLGITRTVRDVVQSRVTGKGNMVYRYNNPSFIRTSGADPRAQRVKLSYLLSKFEQNMPGILDNALVVVASCRGFEGADETYGIGYESPLRQEFDPGEGGNKKRSNNHVKINRKNKKRSHKKRSQSHKKRRNNKNNMSRRH